MAVFKFRNLKSGQATPIPPGEFTVGRAEDVFLHVEDSSVSRHHARLLNNKDEFFVEDLGSANGVAVQGAYVTGRTKINMGDLVHIGSVPFRIDPELPNEPAEAAPSGVRPVDRTYIRKDTERIAIGTPIAEGASFDYSAPVVQSTPKELAQVRKSVPLPALVKLMESSSLPEVKPATPASAEVSPVAASKEPASPPEEALTDEDLSSDPTEWWWWMAFFLAGLGTGLLLGLYFARFFLEMGGKASSLPL